MPDARRATPIGKPRMGLLAAASVTEPSSSAGGARWGWGVEWRPEMVGEDVDAFGVRELVCTTSPALTHTELPTNEVAYPFQVWSHDPCPSIIDSADLADPRDRRARSERLLLAVRSAAIAKEFWAGALSTAQGLANVWLNKAGSTAVTTAAAAPEKALAKLDNAIAVNLSNGRGMIHCRVEVLDRLASSFAIRREGNLWLTPFDNVVVADAGYDGTGPVAGEWMFATTMVEILLGDIRTNEIAEGFVRTTNDVVVESQQDVIVLHEPHLLWHRAQVDLT